MYWLCSLAATWKTEFHSPFNNWQGWLTNGLKFQAVFSLVTEEALYCICELYDAATIFFVVLAIMTNEWGVSARGVVRFYPLIQESQPSAAHGLKYWARNMLWAWLHLDFATNLGFKWWQIWCVHNSVVMSNSRGSRGQQAGNLLLNSELRLGGVSTKQSQPEEMGSPVTVCHPLYFGVKARDF